MPVWPRYLQEIRRAEDYAVFGREDPRRLLQQVRAHIERELSRALRDAE